MRAAVVGHVEWVRFARRRAACRSRARSSPRSDELGGAGRRRGGRGRELVRLGAEVDFFVAVGNDELGAAGSRAARAARLPRRTRRPATSRSGAPSPTSTRTASGRSRCWAEAPSARRRPAPLGRARRDRRGLLHRGRRGRAARRAAGARPRRDGARAPDARRGRRSSSMRSSAAASTPSEAYEPGQLDPQPSWSSRRWGARAARSSPGRARAALSRPPSCPAPVVRRLRRGRLASPRASRSPSARRRATEQRSRSPRSCGAAALTRRGAYEGSPLCSGRTGRVVRRELRCGD